jgi:hypothetical protein
MEVMGMFQKLTCSIAVITLLSIGSGVQALTITTADGKGADTYLTNDSPEGPNTNTSAEVRMRAFRQLADTRSKTGYIRFDLGDAVGDMSGATLTFEATFLKGSAKVVQVYGLIDGDGDLWDESTITYNTAPGMLTATLGNYALDTAKVTLLGTITTPAVGDPYPVRFSSNPTDLPLTSFLGADTNKLVTFIFIGTDNEGEIASKEHATFNPPTLTLPNAVTGVRTSAIYLNPANGAGDVPRDVVLSWVPGAYADKHDVYFGTSFADVNAASRTNPLGVLVKQNHDSNTYDPLGFAQGGSAGLLEFSQTYYWRVDEINAPPDYTPYRGSIWSFTAEPFVYLIQNITAMASSSEAGKGAENTVNGSGLDAADLHSTASNAMWLSSSTGPQPTQIQYQFDQTYKLHQMWVWNYNAEGMNVAYGIQDARIEYSTNGTDWKVLGDVKFPRAPGSVGYAHDTTIDFGGLEAKYVRITANSNWSGGMVNQYGLSEVRFLYIPVRPREPKPASGATDVAPDVVLNWRAGREAASHQVYLSANRKAVENGTALVATVSQSSYTPGPLALGKTYYWKIAEVNQAASPTLWEGDLWSFSTVQYLVVDDFESYTDDVGNRVFQTWKDGFGYTEPAPGYGGNGTGSAIGNASTPFMESSIVHDGTQSVPFGYNNTGAGGKVRYSETERTWAVPQDWTRNGVKALTLWFYGDPNNSAEPLYAAVQDSLGKIKVVVHENPGAVQLSGWQEWNIDLKQFAIAGVSLASIKTMYIGVGNRTTPQAGGTGTMYFDDIRLYPPRCRPAVVKPAASINGDCIVDDVDLQIVAQDWLVRDVPEAAWSGAFSSQDIGATTPAGSFTFDGNIYTIQADGADVFGTADAFHYAYRQISGDCQMTVRVTGLASVAGSDGWSKAGVMIRQSLDAGSPNVMVATSDTNGGGATFQWRPTQAGTSSSERLLQNLYTVTEPACIRLIRRGNTFTGYIFLDGRWQQEGQTTITMTDPVYIGLAVTSHASGALTTATFDRACTFSGADLRADSIVDFKDYAVLADSWLDEVLWP